VGHGKKVFISHSSKVSKTATVIFTALECEPGLEVGFGEHAE